MVKSPSIEKTDNSSFGFTQSLLQFHVDFSSVDNLLAIEYSYNLSSPLLLV